MMEPSYLRLSESELEHRIEGLYRILESCELCPRRVNRLKELKGYCIAIQGDGIISLPAFRGGVWCPQVLYSSQTAI